MSVSEFYQLGPIGQVAVNLFYGWGYNFYREENLLRADDLMIRAKAGWILGMARASVESAEADYRRTAMPAPSRAKPFPDAAAVANAQALERLSKAIGALDAQIRTQPAPENDRMTQVYRREAPTLLRLRESDQILIGQAELLRVKLDQQTGAAIVALLPVVTEGLVAIGKTLRDRQAILFDMETGGH